MNINEHISNDTCWEKKEENPHGSKKMILNALHTESCVLVHGLNMFYRYPNK